jgi:hypothetical protein
MKESMTVLATTTLVAPDRCCVDKSRSPLFKEETNWKTANPTAYEATAK